MTFVGIDQPYYARILFVGFAVIAAISCFYQITYLKSFKIIPIYLLPLLSFFICYENCILYLASTISPNSSLAYAAYVFHSLEIPLFIVIFYEMAFRLHRARSAHFICIPFDQKFEWVQFSAAMSLGLNRFIAIGLFILNILSDFRFVDESKAEWSGSGGYVYLARYPTSKALILNLIPVIVLSFVSLVIGYVLYR